MKMVKEKETSNFLKPTKRKIILTIIFTALWLFIMKFLAIFFTCSCLEGRFENCIDYYRYLLVKGCHCGCASLSGVYLNYLWFLLFPLVIIYIVVSSLIIHVFRKNKK